MRPDPRPILIDCDPGVDDAVALLWALAEPEALEVVAITTLGGNVPLDRTTRNGGLMRMLAGRPEVPVHRGAAGPLVRAAVQAEEFHGAEGLGDLDTGGDPGPIEAEPAAQAICRLVRAGGGALSLVAMGPLTNLALAARLDPGIVPLVREVIVMGGARREGGNITASAEYNIYADPEAAAQVLAHDWPVSLIGLDATHTVRSDEARTAAIAALPTARAQAMASLLAFTNRIERHHGAVDGGPLHDPCTIACALDDGLFQWAPAHIEVETLGAVARGHTAVEMRPGRIGSSRHRWAVAADAAAIFARLTAAAGRP